MDVNQYMSMFLDESREHLQSLNSSILELEADPGNLDVLSEIFRSAHTLKGMSATMGFVNIAELTHEMENILDLLRKGQLQANESIIEVLFKCIDSLEQLVEDAGAGADPSVDVSELISRLKAFVTGETAHQHGDGPTPPKDNVGVPQAVKTVSAPVVDDSAASAQPLVEINDTETNVIGKAVASGFHTYQICVFLNEGCLLKSARAYLVFNQLEELGDIVKSVPTTDDLEKENFAFDFTVILVTDSDEEKIKNTILSVSEIDKVDVVTYNLPATAAIVQKPEQQSGPVQKSKLDSTPGHPTAAPQHHDKKANKGNQTVRVDIDKLDSLLNLVGELVINKTRLEQIGMSNKLAELTETIEQMDRITTDLQNVVMKVRMVPVAQVFNRFPRMVRDLARDLGKEINLIIEGEETELDRTVIDEIGDPLVHLLRNAIDHGLETPAEREAAGKNPIGEVKLIARHEGNNVIIMVEDDGKGIDAEAVKRKAVEKELITQAEADKMDQADAVRILFMAGFSMAKQVTDVSGRGVGMDAVKSKIESLGGMVDIETKIGSGSRFKIRLPLTLAIIQALLVSMSDEIYAVPLGSIDSTIKISNDDIKTIQNQEVILLRGQVIPIVRLSNALNAPTTGSGEDNELYVVIVHMGDRRAGFIVDMLIGQQEIVIKSLGKLLAGIKSIAGATILGNGQVALILDVGVLMQS